MPGPEGHCVRIRRGGNNSAVVFVHGLFGHYSQTWGDFPFLLTQDSRLAHCDVVMWGYPSDLRVLQFAALPFLGHRPPEVGSVAKALATDLCNEEVAGSYGDLVLVGHSMGGLVILKMILDLLMLPNQDCRILPRLRHILLYATPTDGVQLPQIARAHRQAKSIAMDSSLISTIRKEWTARVRTVRPSDPKVPGRMHLPVTPVAGLEDAAVPPESVAAMFESTETAPGNHTEVAKPTSREAASFQILRKVLLTSTIPRLIDDETRLHATNHKIVSEAREVLFTTGSRSRDKTYLAAIETHLVQNPALRYYRVLMGQPRRPEVIEHLHRVLAVRDPSDRSYGYKTTHLAVYDKPQEQWEVFLCGNERMCVAVLPSQGGIGKYSTAEVFTGPAQIRAYRHLVEQLYRLGTPLEDAAALGVLKLI